jgi:D-tagatose-1,6-bisphosphate aldolase subunit GatZ/KbaZ
MDAGEFFQGLVRSHKSGRPRGITSICSAHPWVLQAAMDQAQADGAPALIESSVNQVNQYGGYTGLRPEDFRDRVQATAEERGLPFERVLLGSDHLGPYPWRTESAEVAMDRARALAAASVRVGYAKLHLDASMPLGGDTPDTALGLDPWLAARREAELAAAAEQAFAERDTRRTAVGPPVYVIGTDVPPPGGMQAGAAGVPVTPVEEFERTVSLCAEAFVARGLKSAWDRVFAVVVQPGVEFGDQEVRPYDRRRAAGLCRAARAHPGLVLEGHSTDYQSPGTLRELVEDGVAVLKVGPALTFAAREALFALERIEAELYAGDPATTVSRLSETLEQAMLANPAHWRGYYRGGDAELRLALRYSLSDRSRYYWPVPDVQEAVRRLLANLGRAPIPWPLASQFLPLQSRRLRDGEIPGDPESLVREAVREVLRDYARAGRDFDRRPA